MLTKNECYVYVYLNTTKPGEYLYGDEALFFFEPFYVGKGSNPKRCRAHLSEASLGKLRSHKLSTIRKITSAGLLPIIVKVYSGLTDDEACGKEVALIALIGRCATKEGPLTNLLPGGEGGRPPAETRARLSEARKGNKNALGYKHTLETKQKISESSLGNKYCLGYKHSTAARENMSIARKGKPQTREFAFKRGDSVRKYSYVLISPNGESYLVTSLRLFCSDRSDIKLGTLRSAFRRGQEMCDGWKIFRTLK